jgi:rRNA-processing protein FCF1
MRFLADEGVDAAIVSAIRSEGHDVRWMAEELEGTTDDIVLEAAARDARILITEDKDFGELVFRQRLHHRGVVLMHDEGKEYEVATKTGRLIYPKKKPLTKRVSSSPHGS